MPTKKVRSQRPWRKIPAEEMFGEEHEAVIASLKKAPLKQAAVARLLNNSYQWIDDDDLDWEFEVQQYYWIVNIATDDQLLEVIRYWQDKNHAKECNVDGCDLPIHLTGQCKYHYLKRVWENKPLRLITYVWWMGGQWGFQVRIQREESSLPLRGKLKWNGVLDLDGSASDQELVAAIVKTTGDEEIGIETIRKYKGGFYAK